MGITGELCEWIKNSAQDITVSDCRSSVLRGAFVFLKDLCLVHLFTVLLQTDVNLFLECQNTFGVLIICMLATRTIRPSPTIMATSLNFTSKKLTD